MDFTDVSQRSGNNNAPFKCNSYDSTDTSLCVENLIKSIENMKNNFAQQLEQAHAYGNQKELELLDTTQKLQQAQTNNKQLSNENSMLRKKIESFLEIKKTVLGSLNSQLLEDDTLPTLQQFYPAAENHTSGSITNPPSQMSWHGPPNHAVQTIPSTSALTRNDVHQPMDTEARDRSHMKDDTQDSSFRGSEDTEFCSLISCAREILTKAEYREFLKCLSLVSRDTCRKDEVIGTLKRILPESFFSPVVNYIEATVGR